MITRAVTLFLAVGLGLVLLPGNGHGQEGQATADSDFRSIYLPFFGYLDPLQDRRGLDRPCADGVDDRSSSLCAQWKAADAAALSAEYAGRTLTLGYWGLAVGVATFLAAAAAAVYARSASASSKSAANVAWKTLEAESRPFLKFEFDENIMGSISSDTVKLSTRIWVKNVGRGFASNVSTEFLAMYQPFDGAVKFEEVFVDLDNAPQSAVGLFPSVKASQHSEMSVSFPRDDRFTKSPSVTFRVWYRDDRFQYLTSAVFEIAGCDEWESPSNQLLGIPDNVATIVRQWKLPKDSDSVSAPR